MPNLGDYLGQLLGELTIARMHADLESVRIAELYASNPLLRNMPVPHFRLPDVEVDVPVVIKHSEESQKEESPRGGARLPEMRNAFVKILEPELRKANIKATSDDKEKIQAALNEKAISLEGLKDVRGDVTTVADDFILAVRRVLAEPARPDGPVTHDLLLNLESALKEKVRVEFLKLRRPPPRLQVLVTSGEIREAGPSNVITQFKLKISEQGFEWTTIESEGKSNDRLVPE